MEFINKSGLEFKDISSEWSRTYHFLKNGEIGKVTINQPLKLNVSSSGGHRIWDGKGVSHYIPSGWIHLEWEVLDGDANFDF